MLDFNLGSDVWIPQWYSDQILSKQEYDKDIKIQAVTIECNTF